MIVECSENAVSQLAENRLSFPHPIFQVVNLEAQPGNLTRVAISDGKHFMQTLAHKDLVGRDKVKRLSLIQVLEWSYEGKPHISHRKLVALREVEVLKTVSYIIGSPVPIRSMTVEFQPEVKESDSKGGTEHCVYMCKSCKDVLVTSTALREGLLFPRLSGVVLSTEVEMREHPSGLVSARKVSCSEGHEVGMLIAAATEAQLRGMYFLQEERVVIKNVAHYEVPTSAPHSNPHHDKPSTSSSMSSPKAELLQTYHSIQRELLNGLIELDDRCRTVESSISSLKLDLHKLDLTESRD